MQGTPSLYFEATRDTATGEEILYDYSGRRRNAVDQYPWLTNCSTVSKRKLECYVLW